MPASHAAGLNFHIDQTSMPEAEPLSAYARWKMEEDERFYATFPQARYAAHHYNTVSSAYLEGTGYSYVKDGQVAIYAEPANTTFASSSDSSYPGYEGLSTPSHLHYSYDHLPHEQAQSSIPVSTQQTRHASCAGSSSQYNTVNPDASPSPATEIIHTNIVVPSQRQELSHPEPPLMDYLAPPDSPTPSCSSHTSTLRDPENSAGYHQHPSPYEGNIKTEFLQSSVPHEHYAFYYPIRRYNYCPTAKPLVRPGGWPTVTPSPRSIRLSPVPPSRRPLPKKPPLACLFCRGRKIACGPPDSGSSDRSCNQCQRRSIKCEYPAESRRGMRKKKVHAVLTAGPKVRLGRRSRTM